MNAGSASKSPTTTVFPDQLASEEGTVERREANNKLMRGPWRVPLILLTLFCLFIAILLIAPAEVKGPITGLVQLLSMGFAFVCTARVVIRAAPGRSKRAWSIIAFAQFSYLLADVVILVLVAQPDSNPSTVSLADAFFLPYYPLVGVGALMLPASEVTIAKQVRVLLDVGIVVGALFGLALVFLIGPRVASGTPADVVFSVYPIADLTLLLALVVLTVRGVTSLYRPVFFWMTAGMLCFIWADTLYNYFSLPDLNGGASYQPGTAYIDPAWVAAAFCFGLAALSMRRAQRQEEAAWIWVSRVSARLAKVVPTGLFGQFLLLATPVVALITLLIIGKYLPERSNPQTSLEVLTLTVVLLIIARQLVTQVDLIDAQVATQRAQQLDDLKDQFISSVNHELRSPIQTMTGYIELLAELQDRPSAEKRSEMLERARRANTSLVHLLSSILDTRRIEQEIDDLELVPVNVRMVAQGALELLDPREVSVGERRLFWSVPEHLMVLADETRLQEVVMNLLSNAIKYSAPGTSVILIAQPVMEKSTRFRLHANPNKRLVEISVHDEGLGIPAEQIPLLFRRFVRLPRDLASKVHGTGLGLYLCRLFVEAMGGLIWVESSGVAGEGSTFHIRLPAASATPQTSPPIPRQDLVPLDSQDS